MTHPLPPRFIPWGVEALAPHLRVAAAVQGVDAPPGPVVDLGAGASLRGGDVASEADDLTAIRELARGEAAVVVAWPGPGALPTDTRGAWWAALADLLQPGGVAAVRLDLMPGWHPLTAVQDFARFLGARRALDLPDALDAAFRLADEALGGDDGRWYGWLGHLRALRERDPWAIPDLARASIAPTELHAWVSEARAAGLSWFGDGRGLQTHTRLLARPLQAWIAEEVSARGDALRGLQISDYALNQHARLGLFVKGAASAPADRPWIAAPIDDRPTWWALEPSAISPAEALAASPDSAWVQALLRAVGDGSRRDEDLSDLLRAPVDRVRAGLVEAWRLGLLSLRDADGLTPDGSGASALPPGLVLTADGAARPQTSAATSS